MIADEGSIRRKRQSSSTFLRSNSKRMKRVSLGTGDGGNRRLFRTPDYASDVLQSLNRLRNAGERCDVELSVGSRVFRAHKLVLVSTIPYLNAMLASGMKESRQSTIELKSIDSHAFETILDYAYTGQVEVSAENVQELLPAAGMLQMESLTEACCSFLEGEMDAGNCIGIRTFANLHCCVELEKKANRFVCTRFADVAKGEEFADLEWSEVTTILKSDELQVRSEEVVYEAARSWLLHDFQPRSKHLSEILHKIIRLPLLKRHYLLSTVINDKIIKSSPEHKAYVQGIAAAVRDSDNPLIKHRVPPETIYVMGGRNSRHCLNTAEKYDIETDEWTPVPPMKEVRTAVGLASVDGVLYAVGGERETPSLHQTLYLSSCEKFDPRKGCWQSVSSMHFQRSFVGVTSYDGRLFVFGGEDGDTSYNSVECYDHNINQWMVLPDMRLNRSGAGVAVLDDKIYVVGGHDHTVHHNSVEIFDPADNTWSFCADMTLARSGVGVCVIDGILYAFGGRNRTLNIYYDVVERYDAMSNRWERLPHMISIRAWPAVAAHGGIAYVCGGYDGRARLSTVECFDPRTNEWKLVRKMIDSRAGAAAAVA
eukprot:m.57751 g.57751  ORF g.57751 m.57751 type:complete len:596 (+) comp34758_c0_seq3:50-1837(+)